MENNKKTHGRPSVFSFDKLEEMEIEVSQQNINLSSECIKVVVEVQNKEIKQNLDDTL